MITIEPENIKFRDQLIIGEVKKTTQQIFKLNNKYLSFTSF